MMQYLLVVLFYIMRINLALDKHGENVCPREVQTIPNKTVIVVPECCPDYHEQNGTCKECPPGTYGKRCKETCSSGKYGPKCKLDCNCGPREHCDLVDGCICNAGFTGDNCLIECPPGTYGKRCEIKCSSGKYGPRCMLDCDCGPKEHCDSVDGCICNAGFTGDNCFLECEAGTYGVNCAQICNCTGSCNHVTGECTDDLIKEHEADETQDNEDNECLNWNLVSIMMATAAGVVIVISIATTLIVVICRKWCRTTKQNDNNNYNGYDEINLYHEITEDQIDSPPVPTRQENIIIISHPPHPRQINDSHTTINDETRFIQSIEDNMGPLANPENTAHSNQTRKVHIVSVPNSENTTTTMVNRHGFMPKSGNTAYPNQTRGDRLGNLAYTENTEQTPQARSVRALQTTGSASHSSDGYLQPYTTLNTDRNDYLLPYSTFTKATQRVRNESGNCSDNESDNCSDNESDNCSDNESDNCSDNESDNCSDNESDNCSDNTNVKSAMSADT